jgi:hypothetical protein
MVTSANPILFADDTNIIITNSDFTEFTNSVNTNIIKLNKWFKSNSSLNIDKTHFLQFYTGAKQYYDFQTYYEDKQITKVQNIKFLESQ